MRSKAIYFPFINVPNHEWTFRTLLYWEKLSSIVPLEFVEDPHKLDPFMRDLVTEGLVDQIIPRDHIWKIGNFENIFIQYIETKLSKSTFHHKFSNSFHNNHFKRTNRLHLEKLGDLSDFLLRENLAKRIDHSWFEVENWIAEPFMAYLSTVLGMLEEIDAAPVTHDIHLARYYQAFYAISNNQRMRARNHILEQLLPVPYYDVSIRQLIKFKQRYGHLLPPVREKIEVYSSEIAAIQNEEERLARTDTVTLELKEDISEITEAMKLTWKKVVFEILTPLAGAGGAIYAATNPLQNAIATGAAGFAFITACYRAISSAATERTLRSRPLAYLAFANREFHEFRGVR